MRAVCGKQDHEFLGRLHTGWQPRASAGRGGGQNGGWTRRREREDQAACEPSGEQNRKRRVQRRLF